MTDYEPTYRANEGADRSSFGMALAFLFLGLGAGAAIALLYAPKSGRQMRRSLRRRYEDAREAIEGLTEQASQMVEKGSEWAQVAREKVGPIGRAMKSIR
jgi:gas vesicle protein